MAKKAPTKTVKSKAKAPTKPAPKKSVPAKKVVAKPLPKKPLPKAKAQPKKVVAKKPVAKAPAKKAPTKPVKKAVAPAKKKPVAKVAPKAKVQPKKVVAKVAPKKAPVKVAPKKSAPVKKAVVKPVAKKTTPKAKASANSLQKRRDSVNAKAQPKKIAQKPAPKAKAQPKKVVAKKPVVKAPVKPVKKASTPAPKKAEPKKVEKPAPKAEPKKSVKEDVVPAKKSSKKAKAVKTKVESPQPKVVVEAKPEHDILPVSSGKFRVKSSHNIYFSIEDLNAYFEKRETMAATAHREKVVNKAKVASTPVKPVVPVAPRQPLAVATVFDILGLNPVVAKTHDKLEEQDVPRKWKKYYKMLVDLRKHHSSGVEMRSEEVLRRSAKDDAGDLSSNGQHLADAGSESFERDIAYNLISNQKEILSEIADAIKRIKNGTYGICEITGKPIPESRLLSIPYTRCTLEGQQIKEAEIKRQKATQRASLYDMTDATQGEPPSDEDSPSE